METRLKNSVRFLIILLIFGVAMIAMSVTARAAEPVENPAAIAVDAQHTSNDIKYDTLQEAINDAMNGKNTGTIMLLKDVTENIEIKGSSNQSAIILFFNGYTLTNDNANKPTMQIGVNQDNQTENEITVDLRAGKSSESSWSHYNSGNEARIINTSNNQPAIYNYSYKPVTIDGMTIEKNNSSGYAIVNRGQYGWKGVSMTLNNVKIKGDKDTDALIENGYESEPEGSGDPTNPKLVIKSGTFTGGKYSIKNDINGILEIDGGTFTSQTPIYNWHECFINGGTFKAGDGQPVILNGRNSVEDEGHLQGILDIKNGVFESKNGVILDMIEGANSLCENKPINISGGDFSAVPKFFGTEARELREDKTHNNHLNVTGGTFSLTAVEELRNKPSSDPEKDLNDLPENYEFVKTDGENGVAMVASATVANSINQTINNLNKQVTALQTANKDLTSRLDTANQELDKVKDDLQKSQAALGTAQSELQTTQTELQQTQTELKNAQDDLQKLGEDLKKTQDDLNSTTVDLDQAKQDLDQANKDLSQATQDLNEANENLEQVKKERDDASAELSKVSQELDTVNGELQEAQKDLKIASDEVDKLRKQITELTNQNQELTNKNTELSGKNDDLTKQNTNLNSQIGLLNQNIRDLEAKIAQLNNENQNLKAENATLKNQNLEKQKRIDELTQQLNKANADLDVVKQELTQTKNDLNQAKTDLSKTSQELKQAQNDLSDAENELQQVTADLNQIREDLNQKTVDFDKVNEDLNKVTQDLDQANKDLDKANKDLEQAGLDNDKVAQEMTRVTQDLNDVTKELEQAKKDLNTKSDENAKLQKQIEDLTKQNTDLKNQNKKLQDENADLKNKNAELQKQIDELRASKSGATQTYTPAPNNATAAKTGDPTQMALWLVLTLAACGGFSGAMIYRRHHQK